MDTTAALASLARLVARHPDLEGQVVWGSTGTWIAQDDEEDGMDAEECLFFAEGLLIEGLGMEFRALAPPEQPDRPDLLQIFVLEPGAPALPPEPGAEDGSVVVQSGRIAGAGAA